MGPGPSGRRNDIQWPWLGAANIPTKENDHAYRDREWFNPTKGFGFIVPDEGGKDVFVHVSAIESAGLHNLSEGQKVQYEVVPGRDGKFAAENLVVVD